MRVAICIFLLALVFTGVLMPTHDVSAQTDPQFTPLVPGLMDALGVTGAGADAFPRLLQGIFSLTVGIGALLAVIMVAIGGVQYMTTDSTFQLGNAKSRISNALIGLAIILLCVLVFNIINDRITSLDVLNLAPISP